MKSVFKMLNFALKTRNFELKQRKPKIELPIVEQLQGYA